MSTSAEYALSLSRIAGLVVSMAMTLTAANGSFGRAAWNGAALRQTMALCIIFAASISLFLMV